MKAFQQRNKFKQTGILNPHERTRSRPPPKAQQESGRLALSSTIRSTGMRLGHSGQAGPADRARKDRQPLVLGARPGADRDVPRARAATCRRVRAAQEGAATAPGRVQRVRGRISSSLSGLQGLKKFYVRAHAVDGEVRGLTILYDQATEGIMDPAAIAMASAFVPFPTGTPRADRPSATSNTAPASS